MGQFLTSHTVHHFVVCFHYPYRTVKRLKGHVPFNTSFVSIPQKYDNFNKPLALFFKPYNHQLTGKLQCTRHYSKCILLILQYKLLLLLACVAVGMPVVLMSMEEFSVDEILDMEKQWTAWKKQHGQIFFLLYYCGVNE